MKKLAITTIIAMVFMAVILPMTNVEADSGHWVNSFESVTFGHTTGTASGGRHFTHYRINGARSMSFTSVVSNGSQRTEAPVGRVAESGRPGPASAGHVHNWGPW